MSNYDDELNNDSEAPDARFDEGRLDCIGALITDLRDSGAMYPLTLERTDEMSKSWTPALDGVPDEELTRRDSFSIYAELARREKYTAGAVAELWAARQGNSARAQVERSKAQAREEEFAQPQQAGPGHAALMAIGAALGWHAPEVTA